MAFCQPPTDADKAGVVNDKSYGIVHLQSNLGSFKLRDGVGKVVLKCSGTVLISRLEAHGGTFNKKDIQVTGNLKEEYRGHDKVLYTGTGTLVILGRFRGIQWFGTDMTCTWYGFGLVQVTGEFDKNLDTGSYWYDDARLKRPWFVGGVTTVPLNSDQMSLAVKPIERSKLPPPDKGKPSKPGG